MASYEKSLVFGEFEDLKEDELIRIHKILHGQPKESTLKVEFPWDDEVAGACGDSPTVAWTGDTGGYVVQTEAAHSPIEFGFSPDDALVAGGINIGGHYMTAGLSQDQGYQYEKSERFAGQYHMDSRNDDSKNSDPYMDKNSQQSKLQASLKTYERRNKKKRPANYYEQSSGSSGGGDYSEYSGEHGGRTQAGMMPHDFTLPPPGHPSHFGGPVNMGPAQTIYPGYPMGAYSVNNPQTHMMHGYPNPQMLVQGQHAFSTNQAQVLPGVPPNIPLDGVPPSATEIQQIKHMETTPPQNCVAQHSGDELMEVVVDPVPSNTFHIPSRTETYQNQDHERTSTQHSHSISLGQPYASDSGYSNVRSQNLVQHNTAMQLESTANLQEGAKSNRVDVSIKDKPFIEESSQSTAVETIPASAASSGAVLSVQASGVQTSTVDNTNTLSCTENISTNAHDEQQPAINDVTNPTILNSNVQINTVQNEPDSNSQNVEDGASSAPVVSQSEPPKPKPTSWAGLFRGSAQASSAIVVHSPSLVSDSPVITTENFDSTEEAVQVLPTLPPVSAAEDSVAKELGERLSKMAISHSTVALQPRGLVNRGNWCYINGTLQALIACPPFYNLMRKLPRYQAQSRGPSSTPILDAMVEFVNEFQPMSRTNEKGQAKGTRDIVPGAPFEPVNVYKMLQMIAVNPHFKLGKQEDAEEFLSCILDGIHEEMSAAVNLNAEPNHSGPLDCEEVEEGYTNGYTEATDGDVMVAGDDEEESWEQVGPKKKSVFTRRAKFAKSPIADIFAGMFRSAIFKANTKETATLQPFFTLQLDIQSEKVWSVQDALEELVSKEPITGYTCSTTNSEVEVTKKLSLEELPPVLVLHLKCFVYNKDGGSQKLMKKVDYKVELEITKDLLSPNAKNKLSLQQRSYKLFAVVYHHGKKSTGGHYTTNMFHPGINGWVNTDDSQVKTVHVSSVLKYIPPRVPYLLYYRRLDSH